MLWILASCLWPDKTWKHIVGTLSSEGFGKNLKANGVNESCKFVSWPLCDSSIFRFSMRFYTFVFFHLFLLKLICYVSFNSRSHVTMYMDRQSISKPSN